MIHSPRHLEGLARQLHDETGAEPPIDALALAVLAGIGLRPRGGSKASIDLDKLVIEYSTRVRPVRMHGLVAHELGHWLLWRDAGDRLDDRVSFYLCEQSARYLAGAIMLPRAVFLEDLFTTDFDLFDLERRHRYASAEMIVVRMTQVSPATASVWDGGKLTRDYGRGDEDRSLVDEVLTTGHSARDGAVRAFPKFDGSERRVIVVARAA